MLQHKASPSFLLSQTSTWTATQTIEVPADLGGLVLHSNTDTRRGQYHIDTVRTSDGQLGALLWKNAGDSVAEVQAIRSGANDAADLAFGTQPASGGLTERMRISSTGSVHVGDNANGNMTGPGITVNKGSQTDHAISLKSDVTNGFSGLVEADTFAFIQEFSSDGGVLIAGYSRGQNGMELRGSGDATDMSDADTTGSRAVITVTSREDDGSNGQQAVATGNIFCVRNLSTTRMILKEDGELHIGNTTLATLSDSWDDAGLVRAFSTNTGDPDTLIRSEWDNFVQYHHDDLVQAGVIGYVSPEERAEGVEGLWNISQHLRLLNGASWQTVEDLMSIAAALSPDQRRNLTPRLQTRLHALGRK